METNSNTIVIKRVWQNPETEKKKKGSNNRVASPEVDSSA